MLFKMKEKNGVKEYWSTGFTNQFPIYFFSQYSNTPSLHYSNVTSFSIPIPNFQHLQIDSRMLFH
jgi:hypothetical protein